MPDVPRKYNLSLRFDSGGVLDFEDAVDQVIGGLESHMGKLKYVSTADRDSIKAQLAPCIVEQAIHSISDILEDFKGDNAPYWDSAGLLHLPLVMIGSKLKFDLVVKHKDGSLVHSWVIDDFEDAYRAVMQEAIRGGYYRGPLLTDDQKEKIRNGLVRFLKSRGQLAIMRLLAAIKFTLITDGESWLRGTGRISVSLAVKVDQLNYIGSVKELLVFSTDNAFFDPKAMAGQLSETVTKYLQGNIALSYFTDHIKSGMVKGWVEKAKSWLVDDIRNDQEVFDYIKFKSVKGNKLAFANVFTRQPFEVDIKFWDGQCYLWFMANGFSEKAGKFFGEDELFTSKQKLAMETAMAPVMLEAVRDKAYSYPYSQDTKAKLLKMAKYIKIAANNVKVSPLALAGAVADALDDNLETRIQEDYELWRRYLLEAVRRHSKELEAFVSFLITLAGKSGNPLAFVTANAVGMMWDTIPSEAKTFVLEFLSDFIHRVLTDLGNEIAKAVAGSRDRHSDTLVVLQILKKIDASTISEEARTKLLNELDQKLKSIMDPSQALCFYLVGGSEHSGKITQNAKMIEGVLKNCNKESKERLYVTKWERFYHYFS